jgi:hypothetical protein
VGGMESSPELFSSLSGLGSAGPARALSGVLSGVGVDLLGRGFDAFEAREADAVLGDTGTTVRREELLKTRVPTMRQLRMLLPSLKMLGEVSDGALIQLGMMVRRPRTL